MTQQQQQQQQQQMITINIQSQTKMALHASRHGMTSCPIHGIVIGKNTTTGSNTAAAGGMEIVDVIPVCHEVPTKPIVDVALRLTEAYLQDRNTTTTDNTDDDVRIVGWYTANSHVGIAKPKEVEKKQDDDDDASSVKEEEEVELPNVSALRIISSMADNAAAAAAANNNNNNNNNNKNGDNSSKKKEDLVLILVSTLALVDILQSPSSSSSSSKKSVCSIFEKDGRTNKFTQKVNASRIITTTTNNATTKGNDSTLLLLNNVLSKALMMQTTTTTPSSVNYENEDNNNNNNNTVIYDYIDHISNYRGEDNDELLKKRDWLENSLVNEFVGGIELSLLE